LVSKKGRQPARNLDLDTTRAGVIASNGDSLDQIPDCLGTFQIACSDAIRQGDL
jgi:hypothetical protein